ncbi:MAG: hypothetical protein ACHQT9_04220 [Candidatus Saccharimonadales bacterium]
MKLIYTGVIFLLMIIVSTIGVFAAQSNSTNYQVNEVQFGAGGSLNSSSAHYNAQESLGSTAGGVTKSANYYANAGYLTPNAPFLEMVVNAATINLGTLDVASTSTGTATFHVRAYVDSGYEVVSMNDPPVNEEGKLLATIPTAAASSVGTEQFGINLVNNLTSCTPAAPANFGADPVPVPSGSYATGQAATGYNTCGKFQYNKGDIIAQSNINGWGETDYTISYIANINSLTKAGVYNMTQDLVAVATY